MAEISGVFEPIAEVKRVYYEGTGTIYEGMPVCYNFDTTDNWLGWGEATLAATPTEQGTTAEGEQNEGKYIRVEAPATANLTYFAGVVVAGSWCGKTGPRILDIYVPNGAIVPVRTDASTTVGVTVLGIANADTECVSGGRPVALAWETVDRSSANGITLAKLDPNMFLRQVGTFNALTGAVPNVLQNTFANTSGSVCNLLVHTTVNGALAASHNEWAGLFYLNISGSITAVGYARTLLGQCNLSGTLNSADLTIAGVTGQLSGSPTFTACGNVCALWGDSTLTVAPTAGNYELALLSNNGTARLTSFIRMYGNTAIQPGLGGVLYAFDFATCSAGANELNACIINGGDGSAEKGIATTGGWKKIRINVEGTQYWLIAYLTPTEVDMVS